MNDRSNEPPILPDLPTADDQAVFAPPRLVQRLVSGVVLGALAILVIVTGVQLAQRNAEPLRTGPAPDFTLNLYDGGTFTLSEHRGQVVVINFWGSWCAPCRDEAPDLQAAHERFADQGVVIVGVGFRDTERAARQFIEEFNLTYPNGNDDGLRITARYNVTGAPETYIVDQNGNIVDFYIGQFPPAWLNNAIEALIAGS